MAAQLYVSPAGNPNASGSITSPWDLQTALNQPAVVQPGDTIWLRGGSYRHPPQAFSPGDSGYLFFSRLTGTAANPITVRGFPGERALIDGGAYGGPAYGPFANARPTIEIQGAYTWFMDFEIASSSTEPRFASDDSAFPADITRSNGPYVHGVGIKLINLIIHDLTSGINAWGPASNFEAYGNVIFNNGWQGTPHTHGHNVYTQNYRTSQPKYYTDNILLNCFQNNIQAYGSSSAEIAHFRFSNNTSINRPVLIGGRTDAALEDNEFNNNYLYNSDLALVYHLGPNYLDVVAASNYLVDGILQAGAWQSAVITNNTIITTSGGLVADIVVAQPGAVLPPWTWDGNTYYAYDESNPSLTDIHNFGVETEGFRDFPAWNARTGYDGNSAYLNALPTANYIIFRPNQYDSNRAHIMIYNWQNLSTVMVDTAAALAAQGWVAGDVFELHSAQDYFNDIVSGVYDGSSITVDMNAAGHTVGLPLGWTNPTGANTFPRFGAFILLKKQSVNAPPPNNPPTVSMTSPANGASFAGPANINLIATANDSDGTVANVAFFDFKNSIWLGTATSSPYSITLNNVPGGTHSLIAYATDNTGAVSASAPVNITVTGSSTDPSFVTSVVLGPTRNDFTGWLGMKFTVGATPLTVTSLGRFYLSGNTAAHLVKLVNASTGADVPNGSVSVAMNFGSLGQFMYQALARPITLAANTSYYLVSQEMPGGDRWATQATSVTAKSVASCDGGILSKPGGWTFRLPVNTAFVPVNLRYAWSPVFPVVSISSLVSGATFTAPANLTITASASDSDGSVTNVEFYSGTTLLTTKSTAPYSTAWNNVAAGDYTIFARAKDNDGLVATSDPIDITVNPLPNVPPAISISSPANGATFTAPANFTITASASDTDGSVTNVEFYNGTILLGSASTAPYSIAWNNVMAGDYTLYTLATDDLGLAATSNPIDITVNRPSNFPPAIGISSPADGAIFTAPADLTITASASDIDGSVTNVEFYNGTILLGTAGTAPYSIAWNNVMAGDYTLSARATDDMGLVAISNPIDITVDPPPNVPPTISISGPADGAILTEPVDLTITASAADTDGTVTNVEFYNGTILLGTASTAPFSIPWNNVVAGNYTLTARATDNAGLAATSNPIDITVNPPPNAPLASISSPANGAIFAAPANFTIAASASDTDGTVTNVEFYSGTTLLGTASTAPYTIPWNNVGAGNYTLTARATDDNGLAATSNPITIKINAAPTVTISNPANGATFPAPANLTITAGASDTDGTVTNVEFYNGTTLLGTASAAPYTIPWNNVGAGNYTLTARATDNNGLAATSSPIAIKAGAAPNINISSPADGATFPAPANLTITASARDTDGTVTNVEFYSGTTLLGTVSTAPYTIPWNNVGAGNYTLTARATDDDGLAATSNPIAITVNAPPTINISNPANGATFPAPANLTITASASDTDGTVTNVEFYSGTTLLGTVSTAPYTIPWNNVGAGNYTLAARATDDNGLAAISNPIAITVNAPPTINVSNPANGATFPAPADLTITASASDIDGTVTNVEFYSGTTLLGTASTAPYSIPWNNVGAGNYTLTARATDNNGLAAISNPIAITVNAPPTVAISSPANGAIITAPANLTITASASDTDGTVTNVEFYSGTTLLGTASTAPYSIPWNNVVAGNYTLTARATDDNGLAATSNPIAIKVNAPPTINISNPANGAIFSAPANLTITASASDPDGTVTNVEFYSGTTLLGTASTAPYNIPWNNVGAGNYTLTARATDNNGLAATSNPISITVNPPPNIPPTVSISSPANGATFAAPANLSITASASDADGSVTNVEFYNGTTLLAAAKTAPFSITLNNFPAGTYAIIAYARDNSGAVSASAPVNVTVTAGNVQSPFITSTVPGSARNDFNGWLGMKFTVGASPLSVTSLGRFFLSGNHATHSIKLVNASTGADVPNGSVSVAMNLGTLGQFTYQALVNPVTLAANTSYYLVSQEIVGGDQWAAQSSTTVTTTPVASCDGGILSNSGGWTFRTPANTTFVPVSFQFASSGAYPVVSISSPVNGATFTAPANITLTVSSSDSDGSVTKVEFYNGTTLLGTKTTAPYSIPWNNVGAGNYTLTARATDNTGLTATSSPIGITVNPPPNIPPTVSISSPANGAIVTVPASIVITASASDSDGTVSKVEFFNGTTLLGTDNSSPYTFTWSGVPAGSYNLTARATDNSAAVTTSSAKTVNVQTAFVTSTVVGTARNDVTGWVGMKFTVGNNPITIRTLGRIYLSGNSRTHTVKLVRASTGIDVANGSVAISMVGGTSGQFKFAPLTTPVTLSVNTAYYLVSQETSGADTWASRNTTVTTASAAVCNGSILNSGSSWTFQAPANTTYGPVSFLY